jgi:hypothetical protein
MSRAVTGTIKKPDGAAWVGGLVAFELVEAFETSTTVYPAEIHTETADANGAVSITLATPDTGTAHYKITLPNNQAYDVYIASGAAVDLVTLLTIAGTNVDPDDLQVLLDAAAVLSPIRTLTSAGTLATTDDYTRFSGTFSQPLPLATGSKYVYLVKNVGTGAITFTRAGATSKVLFAGYACAFIDTSSGVWDSVGD